MQSVYSTAFPADWAREIVNGSYAICPTDDDDDDVDDDDDDDDDVDDDDNDDNQTFKDIVRKKINFINLKKSISLEAIQNTEKSKGVLKMIFIQFLSG